MQMQKVKSSTVSEIGHEGDRLRVKFCSGIIYEYHGVGKEAFDLLLNSKSVGTHLNAVIKTRYKATKLTK